jgi:hypothetical protein
MKHYVIYILIPLLAGAAFAQRQSRKHTANSVSPIKTVPADQQPPVESEHDFKVKGDDLSIHANGIPDHLVGEFPNRRNPHAIEAQDYSFDLPAEPQVNQKPTPLHGDGAGRGAPNMPFGVALNGVVMDPGTAEFWNGDRRSGWNYEALGGAVQLGVDDNMAHVQPSGAYHYHGMPRLHLEKLGLKKGQHSPQIGWAADGFPVYALYGYDGKNQSRILTHTSSYQLKTGERPSAPEGPGGTYDGSFVQDYVYVEGAGTLDECNGCFTITPEFPKGTYAYFLTEDWPVIPRAFRGTPVMLRRPQHNHGHPPGRH